MLLAFLRSLCNLLQGIVVVLLPVMSHAVTLYQPLYIKNDIPNVPARTYRACKTWLQPEPKPHYHMTFPLTHISLWPFFSTPLQTTFRLHHFMPVFLVLCLLYSCCRLCPCLFLLLFLFSQQQLSDIFLPPNYTTYLLYCQPHSTFLCWAPKSLSI